MTDAIPPQSPPGRFGPALSAMILLRIARAGERLAAPAGGLPPGGARRRLTLAPGMTLASAVSAVRVALRESPASWVIVSGRAAVPFLRAVGGDLSLAVAGAFLITPRRWSALPLDLAPLPFPSVLVAPEADPLRETCAKAWGSLLLTGGADLFDRPLVRALIERRSRDLARA